MLVQHSTGLRPSELLALQPEHIHLPLDRMQSLTIRLGVTYSTKVKREQYVLVDPVSQPLAFSLVARLCIVTPRGSRLFPFGYQTYNNAFKLAEAHYDLHLGTTAHSGRAGFATHQVLQGCPRKEVQARGRWLSESSFNTYIDVSGASHIAAQVSSQNHPIICHHTTRDSGDKTNGQSYLECRPTFKCNLRRQQLLSRGQRQGPRCSSAEGQLEELNIRLVPGAADLCGAFWVEAH